MNQQGTIALVPTNDEMTLVGGNMSIAKTNVYRSLVGQPLLAGNTNPATVAASYCQNLVNIQPARNNLDMAKELNFGTPVAAVGNNLATFLGNRLSMSFTNLGCANDGLANPVTATLDGNGVATAVTFNRPSRRRRARPRRRTRQPGRRPARRRPAGAGTACRPRLACNRHQITGAPEGEPSQRRGDPGVSGAAAPCLMVGKMNVPRRGRSA